MQYLTKLKTILPFKVIIILLLTFLYCFIFLSVDHKSKYDIKDTEFIGIISKITYSDNRITLTIKGQEKLLVNYYYSDEFSSDLKLGDKIKVTGELEEPNSNSNFNLFNYKKYLLSQKIKYIVKARKIETIKENKNIFYVIKNTISEQIRKSKNSDYLSAFILGDSSSINKQVKQSYQINGLSHLFAVSGMHISFLSGIISSLLKKVKGKIKNVILIMFLLYFAFLVNFSPSVMRSVIFMILLMIKKDYKLDISTFNLFIILTCSFLFYNPYYIYNMGFLYSFVISGFLIFYQQKSKSRNYFYTLLKTSIIAFLASFPISIYNYFELNLLSPFLNLLFVPLVSLVLFPLSFIVVIITPLNFIYSLLINLLEKLSLIFSNIDIFKVILARPHVMVIFIYYFIVMLILANKKNTVILIVLLLLHSHIRLLSVNPVITMLDVGQGDSILIELPHDKANILVDTGGSFNSTSNYISDNIIIPYLRSVGITKIDYLILTHGDFDHMGETINLVENFKVEKVIFNCGAYNDLENELIKVLDNKKIEHYSCVKELNLNNSKLYFLNTKEYDNENDNSSVIYTELNNYKFLFMGDASIKVEKDLLQKYNLFNIDVFKVGHHGSKTSSSKEFVDTINPKYGVISVGKNNRYGHPNKEVLDNLNGSKIYRTDINGSIMFKIKNNSLEFETCPP